MMVAHGVCRVLFRFSPCCRARSSWSGARAGAASMIGARGFPVAWVILIVSGAFEAVWAVALGKSDGFTRLWPSVIFFAALFVSMGGLAIAMRELPTGTSYAIWVAIGAVLAVTYSMVTGEES